MKILALDPGGTTGFAAYDGNAQESISKFAEGQIGPEDHHEELTRFMWRYFTEKTGSFLVCERFEYRNQSRAGLDLSSREYIGVAKLFSQQSGIPVIFQNASQAKGFVQDRHIRKLGLWYPDHKHAMDAMRHLLYFMIHSPQSSPDIQRRLLQAAWKDNNEEPHTSITG